MFTFFFKNIYIQWTQHIYQSNIKMSKSQRKENLIEKIHVIQIEILIL